MSARHVRQRATSLRILLVDDDEGEFLLVRDLLGRFPGRAVALDWVTSSSEALRTFRDVGAHDLYLIDYKLLDHNGIDVVRDLRASGCRAPLLMLTTVADDSVDRQSMRAGAADYLIKGEMTRPLLHRSIRHALERDAMVRALRESEERYRSLARNFPNGCLFVVDHEGRVTLAEGSALAVLAGGHLDGAALVGRPVREALPGVLGERVLQEATRALGGKASAAEYEHDGRRWLLSAAPQPRFDALPQAVVVAKDLTAVRGDVLGRLVDACAKLAARGALPPELQEPLDAARVPQTPAPTGLPPTP